MGKKKVATILATAALIGSLLSTSAFAAETHESHRNHGKGTLVGLGDSISFGYNLGKTNDHPSKLAFPYLIGLAAKEKVKDLAVPSMTSTDLLKPLNTNVSFQKAVKHADKVTIETGSMDLLNLVKATNGNLTQQQVYAAAGIIQENLKAIIAKVRCLSPHADIVVYNIYNPFQENDPLHRLGAEFLPGVNAVIAQTVASFHNNHILVANAYDTFNGNEAKFIRPNDVHPTVAGQKKLAEIGFADFVLEGLHKRSLNKAER